MPIAEVTMPIAFPQLGRTRWHYVASVLPSGTIVFKGDVYSDTSYRGIQILPDTGYEMTVNAPLTPDEFRAVPWDKVQHTSVRYDTIRFEFPWQGPGVQLRDDGPSVYEVRLTKNPGADFVTRLQGCVRRRIEEGKRGQWTSIVVEGLNSWLKEDTSFLIAKFSYVPDVKIVPEEDMFVVKVPNY
jgi:hypothetical protein